MNTYDIDYINKNWLIEGAVPYSEEQIVDAFNETLNILGEEWLGKFKLKNGIEQVGTYITISLINIGQQLKILKRGINNESLITKLNSEIETERIKGLAELNAINFLCSDDDIEFELEPQVVRTDKTPSNPDFRLRKKKDKNWVYVEVKQPDTSDENKMVKIIIKKIIKLIETHNDFHSVEIMLLRIPSDKELEIIIDTCSFLFKQKGLNELEIENLGLIVANHIKGVNYYPLEYQGFVDKPVLSQLEAILELNEKGEKIMRQPVACRIMVSDERARRFLIDASKQLPVSSLNLIWIDSINVPSVKIWDKLIRKQFLDKPDLNKKISGFITYASSISFQENELSAIQNETRKLVVNSFFSRTNE
jgi:hypothetical protein